MSPTITRQQSSLSPYISPSSHHTKLVGLSIFAAEKRKPPPRSANRFFQNKTIGCHSPPARSTRSLPQTGIGESGEMAAAERREAQPGGLEWRVTVPEGSTAKMESEAAAIERAWAWMVGCMVMVRMKVVGTGKRVWRIGADDPRKVMHGLKVGVALTLVSLFYYTRPLYDGVGGAAMWAIMTVVVVFEYTVGCVEDYFTKDRAVDPKKTSRSQKSQGYKCVLNSKAAEDLQANLARWEPAHGRFSFRHPWSQYQKVGAAMRYCAYCIEALSGCINSEIQAPESIKKHLSDVCMRVSSQCSMVLKDMSSSIKAMRRSQVIDLLVADMNEAVQELQSALKAFPNQLIQGTACPQREAASEEKKHSISVTATLPLMEALPLITAASLLIEISSRIDGAINAVETLARVANFDDPHHLGPEHSQKR